MADTTNLGITKVVTNTGSQTTRVNAAFDDLDSNAAGLVSFSVASGNVTLTQDQYVYGILKATGAPGVARSVLLPDTKTGKWLAMNSTTGGYDITFKPVSGTGVIVPAGNAVWIYSDGTNASASGLVPAALPTGIDAANIADGSVSNTEFQYINTLSSNAQTQITARQTTANLSTDIPTDTGSATKYPNVAAVEAYVATMVTGLLDFKGSTDCSANPNYPAGSKGDVYLVTVAGKIGGASGKSVEVGDAYIASADNAGGTEASVGTSWFVLEHNLAGVLLTGDIGVSVQAYNANLAALAGLTGAADRVPYFTGLGAMALGVFGSFGRSVVACVDLAALKTLLALVKGDVGLGNVANVDTTSATNISSGTLPIGRLDTVTRTRTINFIIDGGGSAITTGVKGDIIVDATCTIVSCTVLADQSGSIVVDIWRDTYANFPPTVADTIVASAKPTISAATKSQDSTLTGWTTNIPANEVLRINVDSCTSITRAVLSLKVTV